jgi:hypothetical protein
MEELSAEEIDALPEAIVVDDKEASSIGEGRELPPEYWEGVLGTKFKRAGSRDDERQFKKSA